MQLFFAPEVSDSQAPAFFECLELAGGLPHDADRREHHRERREGHVERRCVALMEVHCLPEGRSADRLHRDPLGTRRHAVHRVASIGIDDRTGTFAHRHPPAEQRRMLVRLGVAPQDGRLPRGRERDQEILPAHRAAPEQQVEQPGRIGARIAAQRELHVAGHAAGVVRPGRIRSRRDTAWLRGDADGVGLGDA